MRILVGRLRSRSGRVNEVRVRDLSLDGCMISTQGLPGKVGDRILIRLPSLRYLAATIIWIEHPSAGLTFEESLYPPVLDYLRKLFVVVRRE